MADSDVKVFLALPNGSRSADPEIAGSILRASSRKYACMDRIGITSSLTHNFNCLWWMCVNNMEAHGFTHFAMLHSDIVPQPNWLDTLMDEMNRKEWDVISGIIAIKDTNGLTSTGWDTDRWRPRRLTMREAMALPETWGDELVEGRAFRKGVPLKGPAGPILLNTGLMLCRLDKPWVRRVCFEFRNRIVEMYDKEVGRNVGMPEFEPEDWRFARFLHHEGVAVGVTRKVGAWHIGPHAFPNDTAWGKMTEGDSINLPIAYRAEPVVFAGWDQAAWERDAPAAAARATPEFPQFKVEELEGSPHA